MLFRSLLALTLVSGALAAPPNDRCVDATLLDADIEVSADNNDANYDFRNQAVCGARSDRRGIWYKIVGDGGLTTVRVCTESDKVVNFGVFSQCNNNDNAAACVATPPNADNDTVFKCGEGAAEVSFDSTEGTPYYVNIRAEHDAETLGSGFTVVYSVAEPEEDDDSPAASSSSLFALAASGLAMFWL